VVPDHTEIYLAVGPPWRDDEEKVPGVRLELTSPVRGSGF
jgi:hypothetical protein